MKHKHLHRFSVLALALAMSLSLVFTSGCGAAEEEVPEEPTENVEPAPETEVPEVSMPEEPLPEEPEPAPEEPAEPEVPAEPEKPAEPAKPAPQKKDPPSKRPFYIRVNCQTNTVTVYERDDSGEYNVPIKAMVCSSGVEGHPTPLGTYRPTGNRWTWLRMVGHVWGMYVTQIKGDYLFHSVPYLEKGNHGSLQPGEFDKLGQDASHGCIRLQVKDAKWIYDNMWNIEGIELFNSAEEGPLGKPTAPTIGDSAYPGWDPSDPVDGNPWNNIPEPQEPEVPAEPEVTDPETTEPEATESETPETEAPESGSTESEDAEAPESGNTESEIAESGNPEAESPESEPADPETPEAEDEQTA